MDGYSLIISGETLEKWRGPGSVGRVPLARYEGTELKTTTRRTRLIGGEKVEVIELLIKCGAFVSLRVPAERRAEVEAFVAQLDARR